MNAWQLFFRAVAILFAAVVPAAAAHAQDYPTKPVRIIIGFPPGGATDLVARLLAPKFSEAFKQQVIVE